jgi:hypothetical protein
MKRSEEMASRTTANNAADKKAESATDGRRLLETGTLGEAVVKFFSYPTPWIIALTALAAWVARPLVGGFGWWDLIIPLAIVAFWPIQEWLIHVFILHLKPFEVFGKRIDLHLAKKHRDHHGDPWRVEDVFIPLRTLIVGLPVGVGIWLLVAPDWGIALTGVGFYASLGLVYEWTHYLVHTNYRPKTKLYRRLWKNHRLHHFKNEQLWYGVTMLSGDRLLGTSPNVDEAETSETCRTLGVDAQDDVAEAGV